jgi:hypothetical protein
MHFPALKTPLEQATAQGRKILQLDAVPPAQPDIGANCALRTHPVVANAFECEYAECHFLRESSENKLHLPALSVAVRPVSSDYHDFGTKRRLQIGSYSLTSRS